MQGADAFTLLQPERPRNAFEARFYRRFGKNVRGAASGYRAFTVTLFFLGATVTFDLCLAMNSARALSPDEADGISNGESPGQEIASVSGLDAFLFQVRAIVEPGYEFVEYETNLYRLSSSAKEIADRISELFVSYFGSGNDLELRTNEQLGHLLAGAEAVSLYAVNLGGDSAQEKTFLDMVESAYLELNHRGSASATHFRILADILSLAREPERLQALMVRRDHDQPSIDLPLGQGPELGPQQRLAWTFSKREALSPVVLGPLEEGSIVVVSFPGCLSSMELASRLASDELLSAYFSAHSVWLAPPFSLPRGDIPHGIESILHDQKQYLVHRVEQWPEIEEWRVSPAILLMQDGKLRPFPQYSVENEIFELRKFLQNCTACQQQ